MRRKAKLLTVIAALILLPVFFVLYYVLWHHPREINSGIFILEKNIAAHDADIWSVKYAHKGNFFITGSVDSTAKLWSEDGKLLRIFKQPEGITGADINSNDSLLVTSAYDGNIRIWNIATGELLRTVKVEDETVWTVAWNPKDNSIAAAGNDGNIRIISLATGNIEKVFKGHERNVWIVKFTPDGSRLISGSFDKSIRIWNTFAGIAEKIIVAHTEAVVDISISHSGETFASGSDDKSIKLWRVNDGSLITTLEGGDEHVQALSFSNNDRFLLSGGRDKDMPGEFFQTVFGESQKNRGVSMRLWDLSKKAVIQTFSVHVNDVNDCTFSNDDQKIITASSDRSIEIWKKADKK